MSDFTLTAGLDDKDVQAKLDKITAQFQATEQKITQAADKSTKSWDRFAGSMGSAAQNIAKLTLRTLGVGSALAGAAMAVRGFGREVAMANKALETGVLDMTKYNERVDALQANYSSLSDTFINSFWGALTAGFAIADAAVGSVTGRNYVTPEMRAEEERQRKMQERRILMTKLRQDSILDSSADNEGALIEKEQVRSSRKIAELHAYVAEGRLTEADIRPLVSLEESASIARQRRIVDDAIRKREEYEKDLAARTGDDLLVRHKADQDERRERARAADELRMARRRAADMQIRAQIELAQASGDAGTQRQLTLQMQREQAFREIDELAIPEVERVAMRLRLGALYAQIDAAGGTDRAAAGGTDRAAAGGGRSVTVPGGYGAAVQSQVIGYMLPGSRGVSTAADVARNTRETKEELRRVNKQLERIANTIDDGTRYS